jgi:glycosidase
MEFHISRLARDKYQLDQSFFSYSGHVIIANFHAARQLTQKINQKRDLLNYPENAVKAGQINALGLIDEILHHVIHLYRQQKNPKVMVDALSFLESQLGKVIIQHLLERFSNDFPPVDVYNKKLTLKQYFSGKTDGVSNRVIVLEELIMLWVVNKNPAANPFLELFDDSLLISETAYQKTIKLLHDHFETQPKFGPEQQNLMDMLRSPAIAVPHSLSGQLEYIRQKWADLLGDFLYRLLSSLDLIKEEEKLSFLGPGIIEIPVYVGRPGVDLEVERFSADRDWMPRLVLIAKNSFVWLDQLSKKYKRAINRLDQIPDEELDALASSGFTGLWLIGLWERSKASARIKKLCGNQDAIASAYSLYSYEIASELGGEDAYNQLNSRAAQRGIRLASDMVPNHMGIDSPWVVEHPDWFLSLNYCPYPSHTFSGPNLSANPGIGIHIEDHYFERTDAAVEFKRINHQTGETRYIYHGNDGTSMPWNDTAQLNYLNPEVREAVIQTILSVARKFHIIRFDAAMTLAKKHYQRLWFPEPGTGGAIPTRSDFGLTKSEFDRLMPEEFWREVVDRVANEAPDTLLLAEAFWLMESYFVRTLGMHRVYNSAFMHMLRNEDNAGYRKLVKNTLEFDPEILKRYVNFMNNPDERTAIEQFGNGDKYFGVCVLLATMPGLPMFGHGQVEGYSEKYGMEFKKPLWEENPDPWLVDRHKKEIFPLLHRRVMFAGVQNFHLYDFYIGSGKVDENVYAYSNRLGNDSTLVVYNNSFTSTAGWIRLSTGSAIKSSGDKRKIHQVTLAEGLNLKALRDHFIVFRDLCGGLEYIRPSVDLYDQGLHLQLDGYKYHAFLDFHQVKDDEWHTYRQINDYLQGRGVPNIEEALKELILQPVQHPFQQIANRGYFEYLLSHRAEIIKRKVNAKLLSEAEDKVDHFLRGAVNLAGKKGNLDFIKKSTVRSLELILSLPALERLYPLPGSSIYTKAVKGFQAGFIGGEDRWLALFGWVFIHQIGWLSDRDNPELQVLSWMDEWQLGKRLALCYSEMGKDDPAIFRIMNTIRMLISQQNWYEKHINENPPQLMRNWLSDEEIHRFLGINRYQDILWFNKESFNEFLWWMEILAVLSCGSNPKSSATDVVERILALQPMLKSFKKAEKISQYQVHLLMKALEK